ncbi:hypothetical protein TorRG33x02_358170, partial [Trema orientale]
MLGIRSLGGMVMVAYFSWQGGHRPDGDWESMRCIMVL